ncbi:MAG TPA: AsnC family transcriptional regulator [Thermoanaerobaculia bacterium]|nr:AsnC family transcriptional regulator [Thermoanaerobaculia bacterium]
MQELDQRDRDILHILQTEIPIAATPFAIIGQMIDMSEKEVIKRIGRLKSRGVIRQISGMFDSRALGFETCVVAATVDDDAIERAASIINLHPGVTQNYQRNHDFNLWFTIVIPPDSRIGLARTVEMLGDEAGCEGIRLLPTLRAFRSTVAEEHADSGEEPAGEGAQAPALSAGEKLYVRLLQEDLPLQPRPFDALARAAGVDAEDLLEAARRLHAQHQLRRLAALVQSSRPAFSATAMGVWVVPVSRVDEVVRKMCSVRGVSHCYLRPTYDDWPFNVFSIVHGRSVDECESVLSQIAQDIGLEQWRALFPVREFKRSHVLLFSPELESWEETRAPAISSTAAS